MSDNEDALEQALAPFDGEGAADLRKEVAKQLVKIHLADLAAMDEGDLLALDSAQAARLTYTTSLVRLLKYLKGNREEEKSQDAQARVAASMVKHYESTGGGALEWGRTVGDAELADEVEKLHAEMTLIVKRKAEYLVSKKPRVVKGKIVDQAKD